jgi:hypothetical protein
MTGDIRVQRRILGGSTYTFYLEFRREHLETSFPKAEFSVSSLWPLSALNFFTKPAKMQLEDDDPPVRAHRYLTRLERQQIAAQLLEEANMATGEPILAFGAVGRCAKKFGVKAPAISKLWKHMKQNFAKGILTASPAKKKHSSSLLYCRETLMEQISALPYCKRRTLRDMAAELGIGKSTLHRILRYEKRPDGGRYLVPHTCSLLPLLTDEHKIARIDYALSKLECEQ